MWASDPCNQNHCWNCLFVRACFFFFFFFLITPFSVPNQFISHAQQIHNKTGFRCTVCRRCSQLHPGGIFASYCITFKPATLWCYKIVQYVSLHVHHRGMEKGDLRWFPLMLWITLMCQNTKYCLFATGACSHRYHISSLVTHDPRDAFSMST